MRRLILLILMAGTLSLIDAAAQPAPKVSDIPYSPSSDSYAQERCKLDVYSPENASDCPVIVWFHGGGLTRGDKKGFPVDLLNHGYVLISANYRLMPRGVIDNCIDDAAAAVAWAFAHAAEYGGSVQKIFVAGHSAGGYLTDMVGLDKHWLAAYGVDADRIAGLFPFSGQALSHFTYRKTLGMTELQPFIDEYAPLSHIRPDAPPIIIVSGDREKEMFGRYEENAYFWRMLKLTGHPDVHIYELQGYTHGKMAKPAVQILVDHVARLCKTIENQ